MLFHCNYYDVLLTCLEKSNAEKVLLELSDDPIGCHFRGDTTAHKVLRVQYYWPMLFKCVHAYAMKCNVCHMSSGREKKPNFPL